VTVDAAVSLDWLHALPDAAWVVQAPQARVLAINEAAAQLLARDAAQVVGAPAQDLLASLEDHALWDELRAGHTVRIDSSVRCTAADGRPLVLRRRVVPLEPASTGRLLVTVRDVQERLDERAQRVAELESLHATLESTDDGLLVTDLGGRVSLANARLAALWRLPAPVPHPCDAGLLYDVLGRLVARPAGMAQRLRELAASESARADERMQLACGATLELSTRPQLSRGRAIGRVWTFRDVTDREAVDRRLHDLATTDALTGLPHRARFSAMLDDALRRARAEGGSLALLLVDVDRFKHLNDSLGSELGDQALREMARRLAEGLRQDDAVARIGGDQFALLLDGADRHGADAAARRVLEAAARDLVLQGTPFTLTCSVGVALFPADAGDGGALVRLAETAMRSAKQAGRACHRFHQARREGDPLAAMKLDHAMRRALPAGQMHLRYQPQLALASGAVVGAEALIRWHDPVLGEVTPGRFIPVAEETGFIAALGDWVLRQAVARAAAWQAQGLRVPIAVNVSALQFQQADFVERVAGVLAEAGVPGELLELELTESILVQEADDALERLRELARLGVAMSIDDFGTGYSSLAYLKRLPIARLKIDRSFIRGLPEDARDAGIVRAIVQMARALGLQVVAEGVETEGQRGFLREAGCDLFQGFLVAPALPAEAFERLPELAGGRSAPRTVLPRRPALHAIGP
jgi:diguanylate cyclase (GGDEF)-like protein